MPRYAPPTPPRGFDNAIEQLLAAMAEAEARAPRPAATPKLPEPTGFDAALIAAVVQNDGAGVRDALKSGANPNVNQGKPLQLAGENKNFALVKELVIRGADVAIAIEGLKTEKNALQPMGPAIPLHDPMVRQALMSLVTVINPRVARVGDAELTTLMGELNRQRASIKPMSREAARRSQQNDATIAALQDWQTRFLKDIAPLEILRQQRRILDEIEDMKRDMAPQKLDKPKLTLPKAPKNG